MIIPHKQKHVWSQKSHEFGNTLTADHMYSPRTWEKIHKQVQKLLCEKRKTFSENFIAFPKSTENSAHFERKDQLHSLNLFEFIDPENCGYFNVRNLLNTFPESKCSRVPNTAECSTAALLSQFSITLGQIELENISRSQIQNLRTVW